MKTSTTPNKTTAIIMIILFSLMVGIAALDRHTQQHNAKTEIQEDCSTTKKDILNGNQQPKHNKRIQKTPF